MENLALEAVVRDRLSEDLLRFEIGTPEVSRHDSEGQRRRVADNDIPFLSRQNGPQAQKGPRTLSRANTRSGLDARTTNIQHRVRKHQPRNIISHEERGEGHEANSWQDDDGRCRYYNVRFSIFVFPLHHPGDEGLIALYYREQLREQHELTQEIGNAITSMPLGDPVDEDELEQDLAELEQEKLDEQMLSTGQVPQGDRIDGLGEGTFIVIVISLSQSSARVRVLSRLRCGIADFL